MRRVLASLLLTFLCVGTSAAAADPGTNVADIPGTIRAMLDAALASGNEADVATIVKYARSADPGSGDAVQRLATAWHDKRTAAHIAKVREAHFLDLWTGKAELSGSKTTGNSDTAGVTASIDLKREGLNWREKFHAQGDYQENLGITTREHFLASFEPNYKLGDRAYLYGQLQYESDRFLGYTDRLSGSVGAGYSAIKTPRVQLDLELGPGYRYTAFTDANVQASIASRGSIDLKWKLLRNVTLSENASAYVQRFNSTVASTTSLNARLFGPLSAQLSYNVQYESEPPAGSVGTDTTSRAGLVYSF